MLFVTLILLIICVVNATPVSLARASRFKGLANKVKHVNRFINILKIRPYLQDQTPSPETILQWYDPLKGRDSIVVAGMKITANVPSVNLDNIQSLLSIKCNQDRVTMVLTEPLPNTNWKVQKTLLVIGSQHGCGVGNSAEQALLLATDWMLDAQRKIVVFTTTNPEKAGVTGSFEILALPGVESSQGGGITTDDISNGQASTHLLQKRGRVSKPNAKTVGIALNLDLKASPSIELNPADVGGVFRVGCNPCGIKAQTTLVFRAAGRLFKKPKYSLTWEGDIDMYAMLSFDIGVRLDKRLVSIPIFEYPLTPIYIPGVLSLGPKLVFEFNMDASISAEVRSKANLTVSYSNFETSIASNEKNTYRGFNPVYTSNVEADKLVAETRLEFALTPKLKLAAEVFKFDLLETSLSIANKVGINFGIQKDISNLENIKRLDSGPTSFDVNLSVDVGMSLDGEVFGFSKVLYTIFTKTIFERRYTVNKSKTLATTGP
ncbi:hypothetical protein QVD99_000001 [Batrachochytrium dendrobatidis]|nr:hypothetical protein QVD99_000001 [Batrachochytrium dendrobatidis]